MSELLDELRCDQEVAAHGWLTLDRDKARQKLQKFRLPSPHMYVIQLVRAARILGAEELHFEISIRDTICRFDRTFEPGLLEDFWSAAFIERHDAETRAVHCLALGIGSAQALSPEWIRIDTAGVSLHITEDGETYGPRGDQTDGTVVHVREALRLGHVSEFLAEIFGEQAETKALRELCSIAPFDVFVNGRRLGREPEEGKFGQPFAVGEARGFVELDRKASSHEIVLLRDGVGIGRLSYDVHGVAMRAAVESPLLQTDLTGMSLVQDGAAVALLHTVLIPHYHAALHAWLESDEYTVDAARRLALAVVDYVADRRAIGQILSPQTDALLAALLARPLFETATAPCRPIAIAEFGGRVSFASARFASLREQETGAVVLIERVTGKSGPSLKADYQLNDLFARLRGARIIEGVDVSRDLYQRELAQRNRQTWSQRPERVTRNWPFQRVLEFAGVSGRVYLPVERLGGPVISVARGGFLYHQSRLLSVVEGGPFGVVIDGDLGPDPLWADIVRDLAVDRVAVELAAAAFELSVEYATALLETNTEEEARPRLVDSIVEQAVLGRVPHLVFELLGYPLQDRLRLIAADARLRRVWARFPTPAELAIFGPLLKIPSYELSDGQRVSLEQVLARPGLATRADMFGDVVLGGSVLADAVQHRILQAVWDAGLVGDVVNDEVLADIGQAVRPPKPPEPVASPPAAGPILAPSPAQPPAEAVVHPPPPPDPPKRAVDPLLDELVRLLIEARGGRRDLFDDHLAGSFAWETLSNGRLCEVSPEGVRIDPAHPLVDRARVDDPVPRAVLVSVIYSRINAWYQTITDPDELELQARLLGAIR